ncbi:cobalt ECF transporter T component CbiQ [Romboutsia weinsteinii]|uniref:Cobalt ECF transporter T component CbiQ n=1 Tax=Romboutsia weinsteinii TaxID=2020949 RepID=A0A371IY14_9FIRM|nr:cobalt ECF transporter T component CbiQ [Romboutsia weinsteinii]RDY25377.1 cobalt ECF transporter T component CbiQ [Romboutsia weinsteinii]
MIEIDKYAYTNELRDMNPNIKVSIGAAILLLSMLISNIILSIGTVLLMSVIIVFIAKIDLKSYIKLLKIPITFILLSIIVTLINISKDPKLLIYSVNIGNLYIGVSDQSINTCIHIIGRSMSCLTCVYFIILTTPFNQLIFIFKKLHISDTVIELSMLIYRFIFIFMEEVADIRQSQELRFGYINLKTSYKSLGLLVNLLYKRMMIRYEEMCISLDVKLYDGTFYIVGDE